jgi:hypothetical protein
MLAIINSLYINVDKLCNPRSNTRIIIFNIRAQNVTVRWVFIMFFPTFVHKVRRPIKYHGLGVCWEITGKYVLKMVFNILSFGISWTNVVFVRSRVKISARRTATLRSLVVFFSNCREKTTQFIKLVNSSTFVPINYSLTVVPKLNSTPWPGSATELYRLSNRRLLAKLVATFGDRRCRVVSATDSRGRILCFLDRSRYFLFQVAPQLYSWGWVDPVPDLLLLRKSGSAGNRTRELLINSQELFCIEVGSWGIVSQSPTSKDKG